LRLGLGGFDPFAAAVMRAGLFAHLFEQFHPKLIVPRRNTSPAAMKRKATGVE
jgi:hypothetical protein